MSTISNPSSIPEVSSVGPDDYLVVVDGTTGQTQKLTRRSFAASMGGDLIAAYHRSRSVAAFPWYDSTGRSLDLDSVAADMYIHPDLVLNDTYGFYDHPIQGGWGFVIKATPNHLYSCAGFISFGYVAEPTGWTANGVWWDLSVGFNLEPSYVGGSGPDSYQYDSIRVQKSTFPSWEDGVGLFANRSCAPSFIVPDNGSDYYLSIQASAAWYNGSVFTAVDMPNRYGEFSFSMVDHGVVA